VVHEQSALLGCSWQSYEDRPRWARTPSQQARLEVLQQVMLVHGRSHDGSFDEVVFDLLLLKTPDEWLSMLKRHFEALTLNQGQALQAVNEQENVEYGPLPDVHVPVDEDSAYENQQQGDEMPRRSEAHEIPITPEALAPPAAAEASIDGVGPVQDADGALCVSLLHHFAAHDYVWHTGTAKYCICLSGLLSYASLLTRMTLNSLTIAINKYVKLAVHALTTRCVVVRRKWMQCTTTAAAHARL
jgi:hypothetical protein